MALMLMIHNVTAQTSHMDGRAICHATVVVRMHMHDDDDVQDMVMNVTLTQECVNVTKVTTVIIVNSDVQWVVIT